MTCLYKYEGTQGEGLEVMQAQRDVYTYILYIYIYCVQIGGSKIGSYAGSISCGNYDINYVYVRLHNSTSTRV